MGEAFPGSVGWGSDTRHFAGAGTPTVLKVTNLNSSGAGSFKAAAESTVPRLIVFEVGGVVENAGIITIDDPYCWVAGQTAPNPGFRLRAATLAIKTHDVCVQHLVIGRGDDPAVAFSCVTLIDCTDVIIDHCSLYWSTSTMLVIQRCTRCTVSYCLLGEPLKSGWGGIGTNASPAINDVNNNVSYHHNVHVHSSTRNITARYQYQLEFAMNIIYNTGPNPGDYFDLRDTSASDKTLFLDAWSNKYIDGASSGSGTLIIDSNNASEAPGTASRIYLGEAGISGNIHFEARPIDDSTDVWDVVNDTIFPFGTFQSLVPTVASSGQLDDNTSAEAAYTALITNGNIGSRPLTTDIIRERMLYEIETQTGIWKDTVADGGGWPVLSPTTRVFNTPVNPFDDDDQDGFTNIERFIHENYVVGPHFNNFPPVVPPEEGEDEDTPQLIAISNCPKRYRAVPLFNKNNDLIGHRYIDARTQNDVTDQDIIDKLKDCSS